MKRGRDDEVDDDEDTDGTDNAPGTGIGSGEEGLVFGDEVEDWGATDDDR